MSHAETLFESNMVDLSGNQESVQVTHVESPVHFYCRLLTDEEQFNALQNKINDHVDADTKPMAPDVNAIKGPGKFVLVFSIIRDRWCRGRVLSYQNNGYSQPINAKVCLIDFGSIEIVLWNTKYMRFSGPEIDAFNDSRGFCFPCALGNIQPFDDAGKPNTNGLHQWSSYANFLIEKETKYRHFLLCVLQSPTCQSRNIVICDLLPLSDIYASENQTMFSQTNFTSLSSYLVDSNVAHYIDQTGDDRGEGNTQSDDEKENLFIATNC